MDQQGRYWKRGARADERGSAGEGEFGQTQYVVLRADGVRVDSLLEPRGGGNRLGMGFALSTNDGMYQHLAPDSVWAFARDGATIVAGADAYVVQVRDRGRTRLTIRRDARPVAYAREERAQWEAWREYFNRQRPSPMLPIPALKPIVRELHADALGRIWVKVHVAAEPRPIPPRPAGDQRPLLTWRERNTYDLFDGTTGRFEGRLALPYATQLLATRGDRIWLAEEGPDGERLIGIYELRAGGR